MKHLEKIEKITLALCASVFEIGGEYSAIESGAVELAEAVAAAPTGCECCEGWQYLNEGGAAGPCDLIEGLYWHFAENHGGQWSDGYRALSALGGVFNARGDGPEKESAAAEVFSCAGEMAAAEG